MASKYETVAFGLEITDEKGEPRTLDDRLAVFASAIEVPADNLGLRIGQTVTHPDPTVIFPQEGDIG